MIEPWLAGLPAAVKEEIERIRSLSQSDLKYLQSTQVEQTAQDEIFQATTED